MGTILFCLLFCELPFDFEERLQVALHKDAGKEYPKLVFPSLINKVASPATNAPGESPLRSPKYVLYLSLLISIKWSSIYQHIISMDIEGIIILIYIYIYVLLVVFRKKTASAIAASPIKLILTPSKRKEEAFVSAG